MNVISLGGDGLGTPEARLLTANPPVAWTLEDAEGEKGPKLAGTHGGGAASAPAAAEPNRDPEPSALLGMPNASNVLP